MQNLSGGGWLDLTFPIRGGCPVYPGDPPFRSRPHCTLPADGCRVAELAIGSHLGTHVDAPAHYLEHGATVESLRLDALIGPACVVDVPGDPESIIGLEHLAEHRHRIAAARRVILRSGWAEHRFGTDDYWNAYPEISVETASWLVQHGVVLLGLDTPGPSWRHLAEVHQMLLEASPPVCLVESLANLAALPAEVELIILPLPLAGVDGSPVRAVARPA